MAELRRGARTANRQRSSGRGRPPPRKPPLSGWRLWLKRLFVWGGAAVTAFGLLGFATNGLSLALLS